MESSPGKVNSPTKAGGKSGFHTLIVKVEDMLEETLNQIQEQRAETDRLNEEVAQWRSSEAARSIHDSSPFVDQQIEEFQGGFNKEQIKTLDLNLFELVRCLKEAFRNMVVVSGQDVVLTLGATGCGKSTMLTSLVFGPESLEQI